MTVVIYPASLLQLAITVWRFFVLKDMNDWDFQKHLSLMTGVKYHSWNAASDGWNPKLWKLSVFFQSRLVRWWLSIGCTQSHAVQLVLWSRWFIAKVARFRKDKKGWMIFPSNNRWVHQIISPCSFNMANHPNFAFHIRVIQIAPFRWSGTKKKQLFKLTSNNSLVVV